MDRRTFVGIAALSAAPGSVAAAGSDPILDAGVREQQARMGAGLLTAEALTRACLARIASIDRA